MRAFKALLLDDLQAQAVLIPCPAVAACMCERGEVVASVGRCCLAALASMREREAMGHLPLYRQSQIFDREGLGLNRSTLVDWVGKSTELLEPLAAAIHCPAVHVHMHERGGGMCLRVRQSLPTTPRSRCWPPERARPRRRDYGLAAAMNAID